MSSPSTAGADPDTESVPANETEENPAKSAGRIKERNESKDIGVNEIPKNEAARMGNINLKRGV